MTETPSSHDAATPQPQHEWVECSVRVPAGDGESSGADVQCLAKVRCDDVIDALDLDRWSAVAFQHLWRSGHSTAQRHELSCSLWYLKRAIGDHQAEARCIARVLRRLLQRGETAKGGLSGVLCEFVRDAEVAEFEVIDLIHSCAQEMLRR